MMSADNANRPAVLYDEGMGEEDKKKALLLELPDAIKYTRALALKHDHADIADEAVSKMQMKAYAGIRTFRHGNMAAWLRTIAKNAWYDTLSSHRNDPEQYPVDEDGNTRPDVEEKAGSVPSPEDEVLGWYASREQYANMMKALKSLKKPFAEVLVLYASGYKYDDIASRLGISIGTVMSRLSRARRQMRALLPEEYGAGRKLNKNRNK